MSIPEVRPRDPARFATTRWSLVRAAADRASPQSDGALEQLCRCYWLPVYAHVRRQCGHAEEAQDLTQEFFARLLDGERLAVADAGRGRFRTFLLACLDHFLSNERSRARALKRGGGRRTLSLDFRDAEQRLAAEPADRDAPERAFERRWAVTLLERVVADLEEDYRSEGRAGHFGELRPFLTHEPQAGSYREVAARLGMSEGAVKVAVHRLRRRFGTRLRQEIAQTVSTPDEVDDEIRRLFSALSN